MKHYRPFRYKLTFIVAIVFAALLATSVAPGIATAQINPVTSSNAVTRKGVEAYNRSDFVTALPLLRQAADQNDAEAQFHLGLMYYAGLGVSANMNQALELLNKAADGSYVEAEVVLGDIYSMGKGVRADHARAANWYQRAADHGSATAQAFLGEQYAIGDGVKLDARKALALCQRSADQGNASGQTCMGHLYRHGVGVERNYAKAKAWYLKAAAQGDKEAKNNLSALDAEATSAINSSVKKNSAFAFRCSLLAFDGGHPNDKPAFDRRYQQCLTETAAHLSGKRAKPPGSNSPLWAR